MMLGEGTPPNPTVHVPPWSIYEDPTTGMIFHHHNQQHQHQHPVSGVSPNADYSPYLEALNALQRYLPSSEPDSDDPDESVDAYSCDEFRMYEFKVRRCARGRSHDWTECPYAHPGEKARRRDPRKFHYSGAACPEFRKGSCKRGDSCEFAHGVFECWLHPARYRTQPCKDGTGCRRRVCFFAHTPEQLRILSQQSSNSSSVSPKSNISSNTSSAVDSYDGSPLRTTRNTLISSPTSTLMSPPVSPPSDSPPLSPISPALRRTMQANSVNQVLASLRQLQLSKAKSIPASWGVQIGSPKISGVAPALFRSLPSTPTAAKSRWVDVWERDCFVEEEEPMERVESGRDLRAKIFEKLSKENLSEKTDTETGTGVTPDVGWVSELVK
eukprot:TRINITY_DN1551_c1_g2_i5.p1 TRINITY_DN1551_c1_g2~~TRINITY_DN1551_c1_g2_i5.p1  ORF type:complete len:384 (+),score=1.60 TRINITY_DN1551_c1_g2_i5:249-1400(+)